MPKPKRRPLKEFLILFRNFPSPICTMSNTCLIRAGLFTSFWNSATFHSEVFHTSWAAAAWGAALNEPSVVKPAAARDISDLRDMFFMFVPFQRSIGLQSTLPGCDYYLNRILAIIPLSS